MTQSRMLQSKLETTWPPAKQRAYAEYRRAVERQTETPAQTRVIYQGQPGAYAEEAAKAYFGADCVRTNAKKMCIRDRYDIEIDRGNLACCGALSKPLLLSLIHILLAWSSRRW